MLVSVGDVRLFVDVDGPKLVPDGASMLERPTIVFLHGGPGGDHTLYKAWCAPLAEVAQLVYYDHRGNGRSDDGPRERWNLDQWADDLPALCNALGIERPIVLGSSFGGIVALNYAIRHPQHPARLVLISTRAHTNLERIFAAFARLGGAEVRAVAERGFTNPTPEHLEAYLRVCLPLYNQRPLPAELLARVTQRDEVSLHFTREEELRFDYRGRLGAIQCPVLLLSGELDPAVPIEDAEELAAELPPERLRFARFADAGHMLAAEQPEAVLSLIREFVLEESGEAAAAAATLTA
jgi:pimeloyl-ACP methyl ester carboxylesterase